VTPHPAEMVVNLSLPVSKWNNAAVGLLVCRRVECGLKTLEVADLRTDFTSVIVNNLEVIGSFVGT